MSAQVEDHEMRHPQIEKVVVHMGVGTGGQQLADAEAILASITGQDPVRTEASATEPEFAIREGDPIGTKVTLRGDQAISLLEQALPLARLRRSQFDETGNVSFGVAEHTDFPGQEYDPEVGIYGLDVTINLVRPGYRVAQRSVASRSIPATHRLNPTDAIAYLQSRFDVEVTDE